MDVVDELNTKMALANVDIARDQLTNLLDTDRFPKNNRCVTWAFNCCTYSRFVHVGVWDSEVSAYTVRKEIIPLLKQAEDAIRELEARYDEGKDKENIGHCRTNITLRRGNLEANYLKGKRSAFPPQAMSPFFKG